MRIPIEWLNEYIDINNSDQEIAESFTAIGLMQEKPVKDGVLELEHRMDRADWLSILGCARDLAAYKEKQLEYPQLYTQKPKKLPKDQKVKIKVECKNKVNRFNTRVFKNITVKDSPDWLKQRLEAYGIPTINNIVDITNYVMVELGQPMHAQDVQKMEKPEIIIRDAGEGESVTTLHGDNIKLTPDAFVLTQDDKPTVIGGIVGGETTAVDKKTKNIVLDAGNYNQAVVRKVSRQLKIQNETVLRYDKFLHPKLTEIAIRRATQLILDLAGGECYENKDWYPKKWPEKEQKITLSRLKKLSGLDFETKKVKNILARLEYELISETKDELLYKIPYFRTDVEVEDDLIADVLRINDYKNIPITLIQAPPPKEITSDIYVFEEKLRDLCVQLGLNEYITDPLVPKTDSEQEIQLENPLSSEKSALRTSIKQTLSPIAETYKKHFIQKVGIFEIGKTYLKQNGKYEEVQKLEIFYQNKGSGLKESADELKRIVSAILKAIGIPWNKLHEIGEITPTGATLDTAKMLNMGSEYVLITTQIEHKHTQDLSLLIDLDKKFGAIYFDILKFSKHIIDVTVREERMIDDKKAVLVEITFDSSDNEEIKNKLIQHLTNDLGVKIRS